MLKFTQKNLRINEIRLFEGEVAKRKYIFQYIYILDTCKTRLLRSTANIVKDVLCLNSSNSLILLANGIENENKYTYRDLSP
jgi:hypothetical protein